MGVDPEGGSARRVWSWSRSTRPPGGPALGKSDTIDALAAARAVQSGEALGIPKAADGGVVAIRILRVAYRSAVKARTQLANQLHALVATALQELREQLRDLPVAELVKVAGRLRPGDTPDTTAEVTRATPCGPWRAATPCSTPRSRTSPPRPAGSSTGSHPT